MTEEDFQFLLNEFPAEQPTHLIMSKGTARTINRMVKEVRGIIIRGCKGRKGYKGPRVVRKRNNRWEVIPKDVRHNYHYRW